MTPFPCLFPSTIDPTYILLLLKAIFGPPKLVISLKLAGLKGKGSNLTKYFEIVLGSASDNIVSYFWRTAEVAIIWEICWWERR